MFATHRKFTCSTGIKSPSIAVVGSGNTFFVLYHKTVVVHATTKQAKLRNGGWDTVSTRHVINNTLDQLGFKYRLIRHKGKTLVGAISNSYEYPSLKACKPFRDGMTVKRSVQA